MLAICWKNTIQLTRGKYRETWVECSSSHFWVPPDCRRRPEGATNFSTSMRPDIYWSSLVLRWSWIRSRGRPIRRRTRSRPAALCVVIISIASAEYIAKVATKGLTSVNVDGLFCRLYRAAGDISSRRQLDVVDSEFAHSSASLAEDVTVWQQHVYIKEKAPFMCFFFKREKRAANYLPASRGTYCEELSLRKRRVQPCFVLITRLLLLTASTPASNLKAHYI